MYKRQGLQGLKVYMKPDLTGITIGRFLQITLDAMSQLFFSLSVSMGIMITYGSYVKKDVDLNKAVSQIEIMDTGVAFLAGVMIIPAVFVFSGLDGMSAGPGLMFVSLPKDVYKRQSRVCDDVAYDGSRLCETVQSAEECGMAASDHVRDLCIVGSRNRMERLVCEYRNSGCLLYTSSVNLMEQES